MAHEILSAKLCELDRKTGRLAEYMLDFALLAADQALLTSLEAIAGQMIEPNQEEAKNQ